MSCSHEPKKRFKVHETNRRSLAKAMGFRVVEVLVDTAIGMILFHLEPLMALGYSILVEVACFILYYAWERLWNRIEYGRHVHEKGKVCEDCKKKC